MWCQVPNSSAGPTPVPCQPAAAQQIQVVLIGKDHAIFASEVEFRRKNPHSNTKVLFDNEDGRSRDLRLRVLVGEQQSFPKSSISLSLGSLEVAVEAIRARVLKLLTVSFKRVVGNEPVIEFGAA